MKWIKIKDKLPEVDKNVLCVSKSWGIIVNSYEYSDGNMHVFYGDRDECLTDITHWMELPIKPKL